MVGGGFTPQMPMAMVVFLLLVVNCTATLTMAHESVGNETAVEEHESP